MNLDFDPEDIALDDEPAAEPPEELRRLLEEARNSDHEERLPTYRDAIASFGVDAIAAMLTWVDEPRLAAFAIRTIERVAELVPEAKPQVIAELAWLDQANLPESIGEDVDAAMIRLGVDLKRARRGRTAFDKLRSGRLDVNE